MAKAKSKADEKIRKPKRAVVEEKPTRKSKKVTDEPRAKRSKKAEEKPARKKRAVVEEKPTRKSKKVTDEPKPNSKKVKKGGLVDGSNVSDEVEKFTGFNPLLNIDDTLDSIEKQYGLSELAYDTDRTSTRQLSMDILMGGGLVPGWYTLFGPEQSCKSTEASTLMAAGIHTNVPVITYMDFEGSSSPDYISSIIRTMGMQADPRTIMGVRDNNGKWTVKPRVRFYTEGVAEKFFDYLAKLQRSLPDKKLMNNQWYYVYPGKTAEGKINKEAKAIVGDHYDKRYFQKTGNFRVPAADGSLQALVIVDSYPAMLPERQDVDDPNSAIAVQARMFSEQLRRVKGKMKAKRICVVGINQLRKAPMAMFSNPEYEPGGEALRFFSDVRIRMFPRALSAVPGKPVGKGMIEEEPSVEHKGKDKYRYINIRAIKNKLSVPYLEGWLRLWITDATGTARGFDPVYDTWFYLMSTGQALGKRIQIKLKLGKETAKKSLSWMEFKILILGSKKQQAPIWEYLGMKPRNLREWCFKQMGSGEGTKLYLEKLREEGGAEKQEGDEDSGDDED